MKLTYCDICGSLIREKPARSTKASGKILCQTCQDTPKDQRSKRRRKIRDSGQIPRAKLEEAQKLGRKKHL